MAEFAHERRALNHGTEQRSLNVFLFDEAWQKIDSLSRHLLIDGDAEKLATLLLDQ